MNTLSSRLGQGAALVLIILVAGPAQAGGGHKGPDGVKEGDMAMVGEGHHDKWLTPPAPYRSKRFARWDDAQIVARGRDLFQQNCAACHGDDGRGAGPLAASLAHPPADLTRNQHKGAYNVGDAYLFWRVSEGGQVEPFKSAKSAMPAYKDSLDEEDRWAILTFVHQAFHRGGRMTEGGDSTQQVEHMPHDDGGHHG